LERLLFSLLSLAPSGRPGSAAEVFERLTAIADLPADEHFSVAKAYLNTPSMIGRDHELTIVRKFAFGVLKRNAQSILVKGEEGVGRSRFLDAIVLEAKLLGFEVLRADASDSVGKPFGVARRLFDELTSKDPRITENEKVQRVLRFFAGGEQLTSKSGYIKQERAVATCCEIFDQVSINNPFAIIVDDIHSVDAFSLALLAILCTKNRAKKMLIALSIEQGAAFEARSAIALLSQVAYIIALKRFTQDNCRDLLASMFGDVPNLSVLSTLVYRTCGGNPRNLMDAAQTLVDEKRLRYEGGNWLLSNDYHALEKRLKQFENEVNLFHPVSSDATELLALVALDRDYLIESNHYIELTEHRDPLRFHKALDELVQNQRLEQVGNHFRLMRQAEERQVVESLDADYRRVLHLRVAQWLSDQKSNPIYQTYHLLHAGEFDCAVDAMKAFAIAYTKDPGSDIGRKKVVLETIEALIHQADERGFSSAHIEDHRAGLVLNAAYNAFAERAIPHLDRSIRSMCDYSGLTDYATLTHLDASERLAKAIEMAQERCRQGGSDEAYFNVVTATQRVAQLSIIAASFATQLANPGLLLFIPDLTPLSPLSPAIGLVIQIVGALTKIARGQLWEAWDDLKAIQQQLKAIPPDHVDELSRLALEGIVLGTRSFFEVEFATPEALDAIREFEEVMPVLARSLLSSYYASMGDKSMAELKHQQFELSAVQTDRGREVYEFELVNGISINALSNDLLGLKRMLSAIDELLAIRPLWKYRKALVEAHYLRCRGQIDQAIAAIEKSLLSLDHSHCDWSRSAALYVELLTFDGRYEQACELTRTYLERAIDLRVPTLSFELTLAISLSKLGSTREAQQHFESAMSMVYQRQIQGIHLARCYEVGARLAIDRGDGLAFNHYAGLWSTQYRRSSNPALIAQFDALVREADEQGLEIDDSFRIGLMTSRTIKIDVELRDELLSFAESCVDVEQLFSYVVALLLERSRSTASVLYLNTVSGFERVFSTLEMPSFDALDREVEAQYHAMTKPSEETTTVSGTERSVITSEPDIQFMQSTNEPKFAPFLLECHRSEGLVSCGIALLAIDIENGFPNRAQTIAAITDVLVDQANIVVSRS